MNYNAFKNHHEDTDDAIAPGGEDHLTDSADIVLDVLAEGP